MITGRELRAIRTRAGFSAREFAEWLKKVGAPITTARSVYRLEAFRREVPSRYSTELERMVGKAVFNEYLTRFRAQMAARTAQRQGRTPR